MASNGLAKRAKNGRCKNCQRVRNTDKYLATSGEVKHGFATGYIWECRDKTECSIAAKKQLENPKADEYKKARVKVIYAPVV